MGHEIYQSKYPSERSLDLGTYRILNVHTRTAIQISEHDPTRVIAWEQHKGENQQWFLQHSGQGYQLQNRHYDAYLAVSNTDNGGLVYASKYPTTWVFLKYEGSHIVQLADKNRVLNLEHGSGHNGNLVHTFGEDGNYIPHRIWRFERLGDDFYNKESTGDQEQIAKKDRELSELQGELADSREEIANKDREVSQLRDELSKAKQELLELHTLLYQRDETIRQLQQDLQSKEPAFGRTCEASEESTHLRKQHSLLESKLSQQQEETASLQAKMDRVEYLMSQMMGKSGGIVDTRGTS